MKNNLVFLFIVLVCLSCKKKDDEVPSSPIWETALIDQQGWFGDIGISGDAVYVLNYRMHPNGLSAKTLVFKSTDAGHSWNRLSYDDNLYFSGIHFLDDNIGLMAGYRLIAKTMDGGQTWDTTGMGLINFRSIFVIGTRLIGYGTGIYYSEDTAQTWQQVQPAGYFFTSMDFVDNNTGFAANTGGSLYRSNDAGSSWQEVSVLDKTEFYDIDFLDSNTGIAIIGQTDSPSQYPDMKLFITRDGGNSWEAIELSNPNIVLEPESCCLWSNTDRIYLGAVNGIFYSDNLGNSWTLEYSEQQDHIYTRDIKFTNGIGLATTGMGKILKYN